MFSKLCDRFRMCVIMLSGVSLFVPVGSVHARSTQILKVAEFSAARPGGPLPDGWQVLAFPKIKRHTDYLLVRDGETTVMQATSRRSASALVRNVRIDLRVYPVITWRWKISGINTRGSVHHKTGDDYAARLFIIFAGPNGKTGILREAGKQSLSLIYGNPLSGKCLNYIWANKAPLGTVVPSPYTARFMMIAVESGNHRAGKWIEERRSLFDDFKKAFGATPPPVAAVAIMTDTDDTGQSAVSYFGDISFEHR